MKYWITIVLMLYLCQISGQDSTSLAVAEIPSKLSRKIDSKIHSIDKDLVRQSDRYVRKIEKQESEILKKLHKIDSTAATEFLKTSKATYGQINAKLKNAQQKTDKFLNGTYLANLDSLQGSLGFLKDAKSIVSKSKDFQAKLASSLEGVQKLQGKFNEVENVQYLLQQRQEQLKTLVARYASPTLFKKFGKYQQQAYYYSQQVKEYKDILNEPDRVVLKTLEVLQKVPAFQKYMSRHSYLSSLFPSPENIDPTQTVNGLASRSQVMSIIQSQSGVSNVSALGQVQQNINSAQGQIDEVRKQLSQLGAGADGNLTMPNYKPNEEKTKSFLQRLEFGVQLQNQRKTNYFPATSDVGVSVGYKISKKSVVGIAVSGKIGWGRGWNKIHITGEGVGLRSFIDWTAPSIFGSKEGLFWFTGGAEFNYLKPIESLTVFKNYKSWNKSALLGLSKKYKVSAKFKGNVSLLFDCLYRNNVPASSPFVFRMGYTL